MKFFLSFIFIALSLLPVFAQIKQEEEVRLPPKEMRERIVKQDFSDVPQSVRDCHATGTFVFYVKVVLREMQKAQNSSADFAKMLMNMLKK